LNENGSPTNAGAFSGMTIFEREAFLIETTIKSFYRPSVALAKEGAGMTQNFRVGDGLNT